MITSPPFVRILKLYFLQFPVEHQKEYNRAWQKVDKLGKPIKNGQIGVNTIAKISYDIAIFLGMSVEEAKLLAGFTGHSVRRSGATILAASGMSMALLMIAGHWKSEKTARKYIDLSNFTLSKIADVMALAFSDDISIDDKIALPEQVHKRKLDEVDLTDVIESKKQKC